PATCVVSPSPTIPSGAFIVTASGVPGDYFFKLHAVGAPPNSIVHDIPITLHIVDFSLSVPDPLSVGVNPGDVSQAIGIQASAAPGFQDTITFSCSGLPTGATCNFSPPNLVFPTANNPSPIVL